MEKVIVIGSGGHAKVVIDILQEMGTFEIIGVTSNSIPAGQNFLSLKVLGDDNSILETVDKSKVKLAMGLGGYRDNTLRTKVFDKMKSQGFAFINAIHPHSFISKSCKLGEAVTIFPGVVLNTETSIGNNTIIATSASVDHETIIGDHVLISAGVTIGAYSKIGNQTLLALGSKVISGLEIGENTLIASGAVVVANTIPNSQMFGVPAKNRILKSI